MAGDSFDLVPAGGNLTPLSPSVPTLQPAESWVTPAPDFGAEVTSRQSGTAPQFFGQALPAGATQAHINQALSQITQIFRNDAAQLGCSRSFIDAAVNWFMANAMLPPPHEYANYRYNLTGWKIPAADQPYITAFLNHCDEIGARQQEVTAALWWIAELGKRADAPQGNEPSDADWQRLVAKNDQDIENGKAALQQHWQAAYHQNLELVAEFFDSLPKSERDKFENQRLENGVMAMADPLTILWLYEQALGGDFPSGAALSRELSEIENYMRTNQREYFRNERLQHRYRQLIAIRDGG